MYSIKNKIYGSLQIRLILICILICFLPTFNFGVIYDLQFIVNVLLVFFLLFRSGPISVLQSLVLPNLVILTFLSYNFFLALLSNQKITAIKELSFYVIIYISFVSFCNALNVVKFKILLKDYLTYFCSFYILSIFFCFIYFLPHGGYNDVQNFLGENWNYLAAVALVFYPMTLVKGRSIKAIAQNLFFGIITFLTIYLSNSLGVFTFFILFLIFNYLKFHKSYPFLLLGFIALIILIGSINKIHLFSDDLSFNSRYYFLTSSCNVFYNNILGLGFGSWKHYVFKFDLTEVPGLNYSYFFPTTNSHSLTTKLLVECGIVGIFLYVVLLLYSAVKIVTSRLDFFQRNLLSSVFLFLCLSEIFASLLYQNSRYIGVYLFIALAIGFLVSRKHDISDNGFVLFKPIFYSLLIGLMLFSINYGICRNVFYRSTSSLTYGIKKVEDFQKLDSLYIKKGIQQVDNYILSLSLATYVNHNSTEYFKVVNYFEKALKISPYSRVVLYNYALFEYENGNIVKSLSLAEKAFKIQKTNGYLNSLLVNICLAKDDKDKARYYLSFLEKSTKSYAGDRFKNKYLSLVTQIREN